MDVVLTQKEFDELSNMLKGIARKYAGWGGIDYEDIEQECWLKALQIIDALGEMPSLNLIASSCYNRIFDLCRYQKRRANQIPIDIEQFDYRDTEDDGTAFRPMEEWGGHQMSLQEEVMSKIALEEINRLFVPGSVESEYVRLLSIYLGVVEVTTTQFKAYFGDSNMENEIALNLGYASSMSSGYRNCKRRVRKAIAEYMGWGENYNHKC